MTNEFQYIATYPSSDSPGQYFYFAMEALEAACNACGSGLRAIIQDLIFLAAVEHYIRKLRNEISASRTSHGMRELEENDITGISWTYHQRFWWWEGFGNVGS